MRHPALDLTQWEDATPDPTLVIADGPSVKIVTRGARRKTDLRTGKPAEMDNGGVLEISDGPTGNRRIRQFGKVPRIMSRLVILSTRGFISLEAKRWLADAGVSWVHVEAGHREEGRIRILDQSWGFYDSQLERKQVLCSPGLPLQKTGVEVIRNFTVLKLDGQAHNAKQLLGNPDAYEYIMTMRDMVANYRARSCRDTLDMFRTYEGNGASRYWDAMKGTPVTYRGNQPLHPMWLGFPGRKTALRTYETNKDATDPINAALNYGYAIAENLCTIGLLQYGLNPAIGISHNNKSEDAKRDSFSLDLIEVIRPLVDGVILELFKQPVSKDYFTMVLTDKGARVKDGVVMVEAPFTHQIINGVSGLAGHLQPSLKFTRDLLTQAVY